MVTDLMRNFSEHTLSQRFSGVSYCNFVLKGAGILLLCCRPLHLLVVIVIFLFPLQALRAASKKETKLFSQAYETEKQDPPGAVKLYHDIISRRNFDPDLKAAARWRLLHLQHRLLYVPEFFQTLDSLGSSKAKEKVREKLIQELCFELNTDRDRLSQFVAALRSTPDKPLQVSLSLRQFLQRELNPVFRQLAVEYYLRQGNIAAADSLIGTSASKTPLAKLSGAVQARQYDQAASLLKEINFEELTESEKSEYFYLLGKLHSRRGNCHPAVIAFRQAANYASDIAGANRYRALAAFELYNCERYTQAWGLLRRRREGYQDPNIHLLRLILWAEVEHAEEARRFLHKMKDTLQEERGTAYSPRLVDHAMKIINRKK